MRPVNVEAICSVGANKEEVGIVVADIAANI